MTQADPLQAEFRRYAELIRDALRRGNASPLKDENAREIQVARGVIFPTALLNPASESWEPVERLIEISKQPELASVAVVDASGHQRPVYRGLLLYSWLRAFELVYEKLPRAQFGRWEEAARAWCDLFEADLGNIGWPFQGQVPAVRGATAVEAIWIALALQVAGKVFVRDTWTDLAADAFGKLVRAQNPDGNFLLATPADNPDTHAYYELVLLHAAGTFAVQTEDRTVASAVVRATEFHQANTQPDHATSQPWALFAFLWNPRTRPFAEQIMHSTGIQNPEGIEGVSLMLLADALYCLGLFLN